MNKLSLQANCSVKDNPCNFCCLKCKNLFKCYSPPSEKAIMSLPDGTICGGTCVAVRKYLQEEIGGI